MAGIGFRLRRMLDQESYLATIKAYLYSALISSGPWLITILVIGILGILQASKVPFEESTVFRTTIIYVYAFSLITVGLIQMPLTRYLADLLFARDFEMYLPTYAGAMLIVGVIQGVVGGIAVFGFTEWSPLFKVHALLLYLVVSFVWVAMIFVSTVKDFVSISLAFIGGGVVSIGGGYVLEGYKGVDGYMVGYTLGQIVIFLVLTIRIALEFPSSRGLSFEFLRYLEKFPSLVGIGFLYNLAIWSDKFIYWFSPIGEHVDSFLYSCYLYDVPMYLAYLTVVPAMALFLIRIETSFYQYYKDYYGAIVGKRGLADIMAKKEAMVDSIKLSTNRLIRIQGTISLVALLVAPYLIKPLGLNWLHLGILRIGILGAFMHVMFLTLSIGLLYFEFRKETLMITALFFVLNTVGTIYTMDLGLPYYGYGYLGACFVSLLVGALVLDYKIRNLEFITFVTQPIK